MKRIEICYSLFFIVSLIFLACKRDVDNLTTPPRISVANGQAVLPGTGAVVSVDSNFNVVYGSQVIVPIEVIAEGELEQVDFKIIGVGDCQALDLNNKKLETQSVPYDWQGLQSIRTGFQTPQKFNFKIQIPNDTAVAYLSIQVFDKIRLKAFKTITITPYQMHPEVFNVLLYSQNSTVGDAGGEDNRKIYLSSINGLTYDSLSAIANSSTIDISYVDSNGVPMFVSPGNRVAATDSSLLVSDLKKGISTIFAEVDVDYSQVVMPGQFSSLIAQGKSFTRIQQGKTYAFRSSLGMIGVIRINAINIGPSSSVKNASVDFTYKVFIPVAPK